MTKKKTISSHQLTVQYILDNAPGHVYWKNSKGEFLGCNKQQAKSFGLSSPQEVIGKTAFDFCRPEDALLIQKIDSKVMSEKKDFFVEEPLYDHKLDKTIYYMSKKSPLLDGEGNVIGIIGTSIDISSKEYEFREKINKKEQSEIALSTIISLLPGNVYWKDKEGKFLGCNLSQAREVGFDSPEMLIGKTAFDTLPKDQAENITKIDREIMSTGKSICLEEISNKASNKEAVYLSQKAPLIDTHGEIIGVLGVSFDITDRKKLEADLKQSKEKAEVANEAKSEFLRNMEHQLRTPFSGVYSMVQILSEAETDPQKKQMLEMTYQSAKEFLDLFNNIIDFSRYQVENRAVLAKKMDLKKTIEKAVTMEKAAAAIKKLELIYEYPEDIPTVFLSDENRIERMILNLLSNAIKFTDKGHVHVQVKLVKELDDKNLILQIIVSDTGIGIPHDKQQYIYEKFYRGSPANQNKYPGAGLGLHIVKQFIEDLDGEIEVVSLPNKGTIFICTLPFKRPLVDKIVDDDLISAL